MHTIKQLTDQQKNHFDLLGYLKFPGMFASEIIDIRAEFDRIFRDAADQIMPWDHVVHHHRPRQIMPMITEKSAMLHTLAYGEKLSGIVSDLVGEPFRLLGSDGNIYDCGTRWHTDITGLPYNCRNVKVIFYFDDMRAGEDAFRIIPGSHHHTDKFVKKLKKMIKTPEENIGLSITEVPCTEIPTTPGDVVVFDARAWHAVPYVGNRRHMMSFLYVDKDYQGPATSEDYQ
ncbi:MAG TPA: phytanoyl-CoA dioxygenase family protein [Pseudomonadales bacterium]|nr:phytanoyl-CoA dioxygenase family protein [Pseudomonadales bacterium]